MMKKIMLIVIGVILCLGFTGCKEDTGRTWECSVEMSADSEEYVYSVLEFQTDKGDFVLYNNEDFDVEFIVVYEDEDGNEVVYYEEVIKTGAVFVVNQINEDFIYKFGFRADIAEGETISVSVLENDAVR